MKKVKALAMLLAVLTVMSALPFAAFASIPSGGINGLSDKLQYSESLASDGYIGIPVDIYTYHDGETTASDPIVLYVINTNTERVGTDSDKSIVESMLDRGYIVVVLDYKNNVKAVSPALDWSIQALRTKINGGSYLGGLTSENYKKGYNYVVPSGYNLTLDEYYWSIDKHGADGLLDKIVEVWNQDFTGVKGNVTITYPDGTTEKVSDVTAETIYDCVRKDGTQLDLDLRMDIIYPTSPKNEVPVMTVYSSSEIRIGAWTSSTRPILTGFLFAGYAGAVFDYGYTPMSRTDHYGYFDGDGSGSTGGVTGDNYTYSMDVYSGIKNITAAIRHLRWLADQENSIYNFDLDKFGVYGNSKGGVCTRLGVPNVEELHELRYLPGHKGETRYENGDTETVVVDLPHGGTYTINGGEEQPWLTYRDGTKIPSNVQFVYANCGGGQSDILEGHAPTFASGSMQDGSYGGFYPEVVNRCRIYDVPCLYLSMPELGHDLVHGTDLYYGLDGYQALFDMAHFYLKGTGAVCEYITIGDDINNVDTKSVITVKFSGGISAEEIKKVTVKNRTTGKAAEGVWTSAYGDTEWYFDAHNYDGGYIYDVEIPTSIVCKNGANVKYAKKFSFKTIAETLDGAEVVNNNTLTTTSDGIYYVFDGVEAESSTTIGLRFSVTNDAANTVEIFALDSIAEDDVKNSSVGKSLGEIILLGRGDYEIDVTDYVKNISGKVGFLIKVKNNKEIVTFSNKTFDAGELTPSGYDVKTTFSTSVSSDQNKTQGGSSSLKVSYANLKDQIKNGTTWFQYTNKSNTVLSQYVTARALSSADFGKKINVSFSLYDTATRSISAYITPYTNYSNYDNIDWNAKISSGITEKDAWKTFSFSWIIDDSKYIDINQRTFALSIDSRTADQDMPLYIDDIIVTHETTEVVIATESSASAFAPSLVLHPANKNTLETADSAYVENGANSDKVMTGELLVGGRYESVDTTVRKSYVKLSLKDYDGSRVFFGFKTAKSNRGELEFYGIADKALASGWTGGTINYSNAPANDIYGTGVDLTKVYDGTPIDIVSVTGEGDYYVDITEYAKYMKKLGAEYITVVIVNKTATEITFKTYDFTNGVDTLAPAAGGGSNVGHGQTTDQDHSGNGGKSYYLKPSANSYERVRLDIIGYRSLTENDIGRKFRVTYWVMGTKDNLSFINSLMANRCGDNNIQRKSYTIAKKGEWQQIVYEFEITQSVIDHIDYQSAGVPYPDSDQTPAARLNFEGVAVGETIYIDDILVEEIGLGTVNLTPIENIKADKVLINNTFDSFTSLSNTGTEDAYNGKLWAYNGSGFETDTKLTLSTTEDHTSGSGKSVLFQPNKTYNRLKFYNTFGHELTEADIGKSYTVSFALKSNTAGTFTYGLMAQLARNGSVAAAEELTDTEKNNYTLYYGETPDSKDYSESPYVSYTGTITEEDVNKWLIFEFDVTVDENMLSKKVWNKWQKCWVNSSIALLTIVPNKTLSGGATAITGVDLYIDDIITTTAPIPGISGTYYDFDDLTSVKSDVMITGNGHEYGRYNESDSKAIIDKFELNKSSENAYSGTNSLKITSHKTYNNFKFTSLWDKDFKVGDKYSISFRVKANKTGTVNVSLIGQQTSTLSDGVTNNAYRATSYGSISKFKVDKADTWYKFTFEFTVDQGMIDNEIYCLRICPEMGQNVVYDAQKNAESAGFNLITSADPAIIYVDDVYSAKEYAEGDNAFTFSVSDKASVTNSSTDTEDLAVNGSSGKTETAGVKKTYISYAGGAYSGTQLATFHLVVSEANGQTIYVYALKVPASLDGITFNTAVANEKDEGIDLSKVYTNAPIATIKANSAGTYKIDVTDYIKTYGENGYTFVITSSDISGKQDADGNVTNTSYVVIDKSSSVVIETAVDPCEHSSVGDTDNICDICGTERPLAFLKPTHSRLGLYDEISMSFKVPASTLAGFSAPVIKIFVKDSEYTLSADVASDGSYIFTTPRISPNFAGETITYTLWANNGTSEVYGPSYTTSIKDYCYAALASASVSDIEKTLIADTLNYCAAAQTWMNSATPLVNAGLSDYPQYGTKTEPVIENTGSVHTGSGILGISISLSNGIRIRVNDNTMKLVVKDNTGVIKTITDFKPADDGNGGYFAYFNASSAAQLRKLYTFELVDGNENVVSSVTNYSFETYAYGVDEKDTALSALVKAMMVYGDSAYKFVSGK